MIKTKLKKVAIIGMCCTIISSNTTFAMEKGIDYKESIGIQFNEKWLQIDGSPFIQNERTLIPLQGFIDKLGAKFESDSQTGKLKISAEDINIEFIIGQDTAKIIKNIDGVLKEENVKLDVSAQIIGDKYYVPVRFIAEALGAKVNWDNTLRSVLIEKDGNDIISVERPIDFEVLEHQSIMANEYLASWYQSNFKKEGIYSIVDGDFMYVLVSAGEKPTGGYTVQINSITEVTPGTAYVHATLKSPDKDSFVTDALTYPNSIIRFNKGNIEQVQWDLDYEQKDEVTNIESIKSLVESFGRKLQMVSVLAPENLIKESIKENYSDFVTPILLEKLQKSPKDAPGRLTSSPWPDRIEISDIVQISETEYQVKGIIIEITSVELENNGIAAKRQINLNVKKVGDKWLIDDVTLDNYEEVNSVLYKNNDYGFNFSLPESWKNYSIVTSKWEGTLLDDNSKLEGLIINIRHPQWTTENKRQDIPIMIFTHEQWKLIQNEKLGIGAAPIAPRELGHNKNYVFALPARYNYSFLTGYEEVESILENNPLQAFEK